MKRATAGALRLSIAELTRGSGWCYLYTLTTPDVVDHAEISRRWRRFYKRAKRAFPGLLKAMVKVYEEHPGGHGWHIHFVTTDRIDVSLIRQCGEQTGFGRVNAKRIQSKRAAYIAKYVGKAFSAAGQMLRRWSCIGFKGTRVRDVALVNTLTWEISASYRASLESALVDGDWNFSDAKAYFWRDQLKKSYLSDDYLLPCERSIVLACESRFGVDEWSKRQMTVLSFQQSKLPFAAKPLVEGF